MNSTTFQFFGGVINKVNVKKVVPLTFDDCPSNNVNSILLILDYGLIVPNML